MFGDRFKIFDLFLFKTTSKIKIYMIGLTLFCRNQILLNEISNQFKHKLVKFRVNEHQ